MAAKKKSATEPAWKSHNRLPASLETTTVGNAKADAILARMAKGDFDESDQEQLAKVPPAKLVALLDGAALDVGESRFSEAVAKKLPAAEAAEYKKARQACGAAMLEREQYLNGLFEVLVRSPEGAARVKQVAASHGSDSIKQHAKRALLGSDAGRSAVMPAEPLAADVTPEGAVAWISKATPAEAFERLASAVDPEVLKTPDGSKRGRAILQALGKAKLDTRWEAPLLALLRSAGFKALAAQLLASLPATASMLEGVLQALPAGKPVGDAEAKLLARFADKRTVPYLQAALTRSWMLFEPVFAGLALAKDPSAKAFIEAWMSEKKRTPEQLAAAKRALKALG